MRHMSYDTTPATFFDKLGSPKYICAPMVDQSYLPWRHLVRKNGVDLTYTQMINAKVFTRSNSYREDVMDWIDYSNSDGNIFAENSRCIDRPLIVQLAGDDPQTLVKAARIISDSGDISAIDLNLGCPQNIAKRGNYGAYLLPDKDRVLKILSTLVDSLNCPVTAKIRKLPSDEDTISLAKSMENIGVKMITIHGRFVTQRKQFTGSVDWNIIRKIKQAVQIPIVANGGVSNRSDALNCLYETGADAVMSSEALLENPRMFSLEGDRAFREDFVRCQLKSAKELVHYFQIFPQRKSSVSSLRAHLFKMLHRFLSCDVHHDLRYIMVKASIDTMGTVVDTLWMRLERVGFDYESAVAHALVSSNNWYWRHLSHSSSKQLAP